MAGRDVLRAAASGNPSTRAGPKTPQIREEGELSSGEEDADLPIQSIAPYDSTTSSEPCHIPLGSNLSRSSKMGSSSSLANVHVQKSAPQNYNKSLRMKQVPFMANNNRTLHWQKKVSDDNLVISFSDDESGSDSEKSKLEESVEKNDFAVSTDTHKLPMTSSQMQRKVQIHETQHMNSQISKQGFVKHASTSSTTRNLGTHIRRAGASTTTMDPRNQRHTTSKKASPCLVDGNAQNVTLAVNRLENLRNEIALRESELKVQKKSMAVNRERSIDSNSDQSGQHSEKLSSEAANISRTVPTKTVELAPDSRPLKRLRLEHQIYKNQCSDDQLQLPVTFTKSMTGNSKQSIARGSYHDNRSEMSCHGNDLQKLLARTNSRSDNQHDRATKNVLLSSTVQNAGAEDNVTLMPSSEFLSYKVHDTGMPFEKENSSMVAEERVQTMEEGMPVDSSNLLNQTSRLMEIVNGVENANLLTYDGQMGNPGQGSMRLKSLLEIEDLQDKELEEAQEFRRKCELEERRALKVYRKAQKALVEANERCAILYRKRELYSAGLHGLMMESSSSPWPSSWHSHCETLSDSLKYIPRASQDFLSLLDHKIPADSQMLEQLGDKSKGQCIDEAPHQLTGGHESASGHCYDPAVSTSDPKDISDTYGACAPPKNSNMLIDDVEENFPFSMTESRPATHTNYENHVKETADMVVDRNGLPPRHTKMDYELLEASLRSELVARFGKRASSKNIDLNHMGHLAGKVAEREHDKVKQRMQGAQANLITTSGGTMEPGSDINQLSGQSHGDSVPSKDDGCHKVVEPEVNNFSPKESSLPSCRNMPTLPSSVLQSVSKNLRWIFPDFCCGYTTSIDKDYRSRDVMCESMVSVPDVIQDHAERCNTSCSIAGNIGSDTMDLVIDPFWPFCIFELRGKCNDEECPWQHAKRCSWRKLKANSHSITSASGRLCFSLFQHLLPVPTYHIGLSLIKADSYLSRSVLSGSICQYWQRGFCASFPLPFSVRRILPLDAPFLQAGNGSVADYNWNKHLLYRSQDATMKPLRGLPDSEQSLELALELSCQKVCQPERKKALFLLARAIETNPNSVLLWVIYLHIYYRKEKGIAKEDMFLDAVRHNRYSYELWLMYINSRFHLDYRLNAYSDALSMLCHMTATSDKEIKDKSAFILDIFLQMIGFLCMCGSVDKALSQIYGLLPASNVECSGDNLLTTVVSCLVISDRCIFWVCCIYLSIYRKIPEAILEQFELEKDLPFGIEWPSAELTTDNKDRAIELLRYAVDKVSLDIDEDLAKADPMSLRSSHFLAVSHISCAAALQGLKSAADLLVKYMRLYPTCTDVLLISARLGEDHEADLGLGGFEEMLCNWPKEVQGLQRLWNQYAEHVLANKRIDFAENLMTRWFQMFGEVGDAQCRNTKDGRNSLYSFPKDDGSTNLEDDIFWFLNFSLYKTLQKNISEAQLAVDKALKLGGHKFYKFCLGEHAGLHLLSEGSAKDLPGQVILDLIGGYIRDQQILPLLEPLSRRYYQNIKKSRIRQLIDESLGPVSTDFSLINDVLEVCYGPSLLPEKVNQLKDIVDFVDSIMEITPSNYQLALSVYKFTLRNLYDGGAASEGMLFWASAVLVNSIFQAVPVAPEPVWLEAANLLGNSGASEISGRFHQQAVSVYPFSIKLWQSYLNISKTTGNSESIMEAAKERGHAGEIEQFAVFTSAYQ
ncbi:uncharacterized protein [Typha angustifolia]|uniref:uncharacterized protein isoform X2 n=1 Tax=Typha angustifolia TaxID=59011 RepID=UPI003C2DECC6